MEALVSTITTKIVSENNPGTDVITYKQMEIFQIVNIVFLCNIIGLFGIISNIINMIVFYKQGFSNTVNISFFGLSISDLCCLITLFWVSTTINPFIVHSGVPWVPEDFIYLPGAWPHVGFGRITSYITVFVAIERCLCITMPLKVKQIVTPTRTTVIVCLIYILNILTLAPVFASSYIEFKFFPETNRSLLVMAFTSNRESILGLAYIMSSFTGMLSFVSVIVVTVILIFKLQQSSQWRKEVTIEISHSDLASKRDKKTMKMVAVIAIILIVCYTPGSVISMATFLEPELIQGGKYVNMAFSVWTIAFVFQTFNSSVNIFLYYRMSSKYRETFLEVMGGCRICKGYSRK